MIATPTMQFDSDNHGTILDSQNGSTRKYLLEDRQHKETRHTDHQPGNARAKERTNKRALPRLKPTHRKPKRIKQL